MLTGTNRP